MALKTADGSIATVVGTKLKTEKSLVYNFEVEGNHNYYVSDKEILTHNKCDLGEVSRRLDITPEQFHNTYKKDIIKKFGGQLRKKGMRNPDINFDKNGLLEFIDPRNSRNAIRTGIPIETVKRQIGL